MKDRSVYSCDTCGEVPVTEVQVQLTLKWANVQATLDSDGQICTILHDTLNFDDADIESYSHGRKCDLVQLQTYYQVESPLKKIEFTESDLRALIRLNSIDFGKRVISATIKQTDLVSVGWEDTEFCDLVYSIIKGMVPFNRDDLNEPEKFTINIIFED